MLRGGAPSVKAGPTWGRPGRAIANAKTAFSRKLATVRPTTTSPVGIRIGPGNGRAAWSGRRPHLVLMATGPPSGLPEADIFAPMIKRAGTRRA